jgi:DNA-binding NarL/FixJ family response regulator
MATAFAKQTVDSVQTASERPLAGLADAVSSPGLTPRETEVLCLMAEGLTTKAIAERLSVRFKTVACHRNHVLQKLNVTSTILAVRWAIRQGVVEL